MDALTRAPDALAFLPAPAPLEMAPGRLSLPARSSLAPAGAKFWVRRAAIFAGTLALTAGGAKEMYDVVDVGGVTALEWALLALFVVLFAWVAFSFMSALAGFLVTLAGARAGIDLATDGPLPALATRTAMLLPT